MKIEAPMRVTRRYTQRLCASPERVFPLLCPVREADWVEDWDPEVVYSESGVAESDCVFITRDGAVRKVWVITRYEPERGVIEILHITPEVTVCRLQIALRENGDGGTDAEITYRHTAIGERGRALVAGFTETHYAAFMTEWEGALNATLAR